MYHFDLQFHVFDSTPNHLGVPQDGLSGEFPSFYKREGESLELVIPISQEFR